MFCELSNTTRYLVFGFIKRFLGDNNEKEIAVGTDYALVVVRDLFDLD